MVGLWIANSIAIEDIADRDGTTIVLEDDFVYKSKFFDTIMFDCMGTPREAHKIEENVYCSDGETFPTY